MTASACLKKHSTVENTRSLQMASWKNDGTAQMNGCNFSFEIKIRLKEICQIHLASALPRDNLQGKNVFKEQLLYFGSHSFLSFTKIFVHLSIIAAVCYFSVYKLIGWDAANIYLFKFNGRTQKNSELCPKLTIKRVESRSGFFIVNFE